MKIDIEAKVLIDLATNQIIPTALEYMNKLVANIQGLKAVGIAATAAKAQKDLLTDIATRVNAIKVGADKLDAALHTAHKAKTISDEAKAYCDKVKPLFDVIRENVDALELIVDDNLWPLPKYREMLFIR
jgi:glutamine synthetase